MSRKMEKVAYIWGCEDCHCVFSKHLNTQSASLLSVTYLAV